MFTIFALIELGFWVGAEDPTGRLPELPPRLPTGRFGLYLARPTNIASYGPVLLKMFSSNDSLVEYLVSRAPACSKTRLFFGDVLFRMLCQPVE